MQRELYHLFRAASELLVRAGLPTRETATMIELLDRRLVSLLQWNTDSDAGAGWSCRPDPNRERRGEPRSCHVHRKGERA